MAVVLHTHSLTQESQSVENNQSTVRYLVKIQTSGQSHNDNNIMTTFKIDGQTYTKTHKLPSNSTTTVVDKIVTITHNSDGTRTVNAEFSCPTQISAGTMTGTKSLTLDTIPRASTFTISKTSGGSAASSFTLGETLYVNISRASTSFTHKVYWKIGSSSNQILSNDAATSTSGSLPVSMASYISSESGTATIYVDTYNGSTLIGSKSQTFTLNVPSSVVPTISSITTSDTQNRLSVFGAYVQGKSTLRIQTSASGAYGSSIQSYTVQLKSGNTVLQTLYGSDVSIPNISHTGSLTVSVTVKDSRNRTATSTTPITVLAYSNPQVNTFTASRDSTTPTTVAVAINASVIALNNHNTKSFTLKYKKSTVSTWTEVSLSNSNYTLNTTHTLTNIDENSSYDMRLVVADYFTSNSQDYNLGTVADLVNYKADGTAVAFGKVSELSGYFENNLLSKFFKNVLIDADLTVNGALSGYASGVKGSYTANGGQQNPNYFGTNKVGFLMMNTPVNGDSHYKDWLIMDCYHGNDVGGAVAFGIDRQEMKAFIMGSDAARTAWTRSAELAKKGDIPTTSDINSLIDTKINTKIQSGTSLPSSADNGTIFLLYS